jgi:hypothetical protein
MIGECRDQPLQDAGQPISRSAYGEVRDAVHTIGSLLTADYPQPRNKAGVPAFARGPSSSRAAMRFMTTRMHGVADYLVGIVLILVPYLLGFADGTAAQWIFQILGAAAIVYSLLTRYEWGVVRVIPMPVHLMLDFASGVLLAASPWLFGFADRVFWPHVIFGLIEIAASLTTETRPRSGETLRH